MKSSQNLLTQSSHYLLREKDIILFGRKFINTEGKKSLS